MTQTPTDTTTDPAEATNTPLYSLVDLKLKTALEASGTEVRDPREWIRDRRGPEGTTVTTCPTCGTQKTTTPTPWRTIADDLYALTGVRVNHETLRTWSGVTATT